MSIRLVGIGLSVAGLGLCTPDTVASEQDSVHTKESVVVSQPLPLASSFKLDDYKGKVVLLNFWATYCPPCLTEIPELTQLYRHFDPKEVAILGIAVDQGAVDLIRSKLDRFIKRHEIAYPVILDHELELVRQYGDFKHVPTTFLLDQKGEIDQVYTKALHFKEVSKAIQALLQRT